MLGTREGTTLTISVATARNPVYSPDDSDVLISKSTWPLKLSGLVFAGLLVIGRSASYGNVTWTPAYHAPSSPLVVLVAGSQKPAPVVPKLGSTDGLMNKASAANEVIAFHPGNSGDGGDGQGDTNSGANQHSSDSTSDHENDASGSGHGSGNGAGTVNETATSAAGSGQGSTNGATTVSETSTSAGAGSSGSTNGRSEERRV